MLDTRVRQATPASSARERTPEQGGEALVVFVDDSSLKCLRRLRRGFRHCFVACTRVAAGLFAIRSRTGPT